MSFVKAEVKDNVAFITLDRPAARNALNLEMCCTLGEIITRLRSENELVLVVLRGAGKVFCAGADLHEIKGIRSKTSAADLFQCVENILAAVRDLPMPVLALVNGPAIGAGLDLAAAADIRICSTEAKFGLPALKLGLPPTTGLIDRLSRIIGPAAAAWIVWSAKLFTPEEALRFGLVSEVWQPENVEERLQAMVEEFRLRPVSIVRQAKQHILAWSLGRSVIRTEMGGNQ